MSLFCLISRHPTRSEDDHLEHYRRPLGFLNSLHVRKSLTTTSSPRPPLSSTPRQNEPRMLQAPTSRLLLLNANFLQMAGQTLHLTAISISTTDVQQLRDTRTLTSTLFPMDPISIRRDKRWVPTSCAAASSAIPKCPFSFLLTQIPFSYFVLRHYDSSTQHRERRLLGGQQKQFLVTARTGTACHTMDDDGHAQKPRP
jgi:hypothetical protein